MTDPDWRTRHCAELAADAVREATGRDVWAELGTCPRGWREGAALYRRLGVRRLEDAVSKVLGPPIPARQARRGDIVMVRGSLAICRGEVVEGLGAKVSMREAERAWRSTGLGAALN